MSTDYILKYRDSQGRDYETEISSDSTGARLRKLAEDTATEEITGRYPTARLSTLSIEHAGAGDRARRPPP